MEMRAKIKSVWWINEIILCIWKSDIFSTFSIWKPIFSKINFQSLISKCHICKKSLPPTLANVELPSQRNKQIKNCSFIERHMPWSKKFKKFLWIAWNNQHHGHWPCMAKFVFSEIARFPGHNCMNCFYEKHPGCA